MSLLSRTLRYLNVWLRPPQIMSLETEEVDKPVLSFVSPVFVLSTGRCGTKWLTELLRQDQRMWVNHSDYPELIRHSRLAYEQYTEAPRVFQEIIRATRDGYILEANKRNQVYIETNNRITFFAHAIRTVYPKAQFIHLIRHPGDFVRSGIRREWYHGERHDIGRIRNTRNPAAWSAMTDIEKITWLWNETNQYIENFLNDLEASSHYLQVKAEEMWNDVEIGMKICTFIGASVGRRHVATMLEHMINRQRIGLTPPYSKWGEKEQAQLRQYAPLIEQYGYEV